jgi:hypothetical protein
MNLADSTRGTGPSSARTTFARLPPNLKERVAMFIQRRVEKLSLGQKLVAQAIKLRLYRLHINMN